MADLADENAEGQAHPGVAAAAVQTEVLRTMLEDALLKQMGRPLQIVQLERRVSDYLTSFPIEELQVRLDDGTTLQLIFKNLDWQLLREKVRRVKPRFLYNPLREVETYRRILPEAPPGPPVYYGSRVDAQEAHYWLFVEKVPGLELYQIGELDRWQTAAEWLAQLHSTFEGKGEVLKRAAPLLHCDEAFCWRWLKRARHFTLASQEASEQDKEGMIWLADRYHVVVERLLSLPETFIHGEFYASNVLWLAQNGSERVAPVDWEMAAIGPAIFDLAALTAGKWTEEQQYTMARAYFEALPDSRLWPDDLAELLIAMDIAHLAIAIQWLGWAKVWAPPVETGHNWLELALQLARKLGL